MIQDFTTASSSYFYLSNKANIAYSSIKDQSNYKAMVVNEVSKHPSAL
jgi:hypothetical protein